MLSRAWGSMQPLDWCLADDLAEIVAIGLHHQPAVPRAEDLILGQLACALELLHDSVSRRDDMDPKLPGARPVRADRSSWCGLAPGIRGVIDERRRGQAILL
jgi:hypothetical protein